MLYGSESVSKSATAMERPKILFVYYNMTIGEIAIREIYELYRIEVSLYLSLKAKDQPPHNLTLRNLILYFQIPTTLFGRKRSSQNAQNEKSYIAIQRF
jgi:hypothetical protein